MQLPFTFLTTGEVFHVEENLHLSLEGWRAGGLEGGFHATKRYKLAKNRIDYN